MTKMSIELTQDQIGQLKKIHAARDKAGESLETLASKVIERGLYDINYRMERNKKEWANKKALKAKMKEAGVSSIAELLTKL